MSNENIWENEGGNTRNANSDYAVILPCKPNEFRDFISGLLGKPQTITKGISGPFELHKSDIENFYHLVVQRVSQQNEATLVQFTVRIVYDDESTILLNSLEDFMRYHEVRAITSVAAHLSWTFLVRFQDRQIFEKQQIEVSIDTGQSLPIIREDVSSRMIIEARTRGHFAFRISHTARTWGADIEALLTGHIENLVKKLHPLKKFLNKRSGWIGLGVAIVTFLFSMIACFYTTQVFLDSRMRTVRALQTPESKADYMVNLITSGAWPRFFFYIFCFLILALITSIILGIWAGIKAETQEPSFLLLSKQAEKDKEKELNKTKKSWLSFVMSLVVSVITGVIGNFLFAVYLQRWLSS